MFIFSEARVISGHQLLGSILNLAVKIIRMGLFKTRLATKC